MLGNNFIPTKDADAAVLQSLQTHLEDALNILWRQTLEALDIAIAASLASHLLEVLTLNANLRKGTLQAKLLEEEV